MTGRQAVAAVLAVLIIVIGVVAVVTVTTTQQTERRATCVEAGGSWVNGQCIVR